MINAVPPCSALMKESRHQNISAGFATNEIDVLAVLSFMYTEYKFLNQNKDE